MRRGDWGRRLTAVALLALFGGTVAGCTGPLGADGSGSLPEVTAQSPDQLTPLDLSPDGKLQVVATTSLVGEPATIIGGDLADVTVLIPRGADPHEYQPAPRDAVSLAGADVILEAGFGYETFLAKLISGAGASVPVVALSEGIQPLSIAGGAATSGSGAVDPHVWLDPQNMVVWARNTAAAYAALDPAHAADYQARAEAYVAELTQLDTWAASQFGEVPDGARKVATGHAVLGYLAQRYELSIVGTIRPGASDLGEPSARELADLEDRLQSQAVGAIFVGVFDNHTLADRVGADTGIPVVPLYLESLSHADGSAATYDAFMRFNVAAIVEALK